MHRRATQFAQKLAKTQSHFSEKFVTYHEKNRDSRLLGWVVTEILEFDSGSAACLGDSSMQL